MVNQLKALASKVLFALSINNFNAVFSRISSRWVPTCAFCISASLSITNVSHLQTARIELQQ